MRSNFITNYFGFNKQQRNGLFVLICISFFLLIVKLTYPHFIKPDEILIQNLPLIERQLDQATSNLDHLTISTSEKERVTIAKFVFDPNTVSQEQLLQLGFTNKTAAIFIKYRTKGFVLKEKKDLKKVYGVSDKLYAELEPYILISKEKTVVKETPPQKNSKSEVRAIIGNSTKLELNTVDSSALIALNGIGSSYARRILKYRTLLGGYVAIEQLKEVYGFTEDLYKKVVDNFTVNPALIKKINLNTDDFKLINKHPYISYETCKTIFDWRKKTRITGSNLKDILHDDQLCQKLLPYLNFE